MGENRIEGWLAYAGWAVTIVVSASCAAFLVVTVRNA
jgi:hypothetical protein